MSIKPQPVMTTMKRAYTVNEFCDSYRISRRELYRIWANGDGPRFKRVGPHKRIILIEDAETWAQAVDGDEATTG